MKKSEETLRYAQNALRPPEWEALNFGAPGRR
jgi:hypothetical protein